MIHSYHHPKSSSGLHTVNTSVLGNDGPGYPGITHPQIPHLPDKIGHLRES